MIVVADTSPLNYLVLINEVHVLSELYDRVVIPPGVLAELQQESTPEPVRQWVANPPGWLEVRAPHQAPDERLLRLGRGEREAIALATELGADVLMIDELKGRREAARRHLFVIGTVGVLGDAAEEGLVDLPKAFARLQQTTFHGSENLYKSLLERDAQRRQSKRKNP
jgi:predicted nucleic acid-binding protein